MHVSIYARLTYGFCSEDLLKCTDKNQTGDIKVVSLETSFCICCDIREKNPLRIIFTGATLIGVICM